MQESTSNTKGTYFLFAALHDYWSRAPEAPTQPLLWRGSAPTHSYKRPAFLSKILAAYKSALKKF